MKKSFLCLLSVLMGLFLTTAVVLAEETTEEVVNNTVDIVDSGSCGDNVTWTLDAEGKVTISGTGTISYRFGSDSNLAPKIKSIIIEEGVTSIDDSTFSGCSGLTNITISKGVTKIGEYAFYDCSGLTSIILPDSLTSIGIYAFYDCSRLTSINIPNSVTSIEAHAFRRCSGLTSINIPESMINIADAVFMECSGLTDITIPNNITSIGINAFAECSGLESIEISNSVTNIGAGAFWGCSNLISIIIPDSVTSIEDYTFYGCSGLTSITIPESVTSIGNAAFSRCSGLTSITIPDSVICIGSDAFSRCTELTEIVISNNIISLEEGIFRYCSGLTSVIIPDSVTSIGSRAFLGCSGLTSITIPSSVTTIGYSTFEDCSSLTSMTIPDSVDSIENSTFKGCSGLTNIIIPDSVMSIGDYTFEGCSRLTSITIPDSVMSIGDSAFDNWSKNASIFLECNPPEIISKAFNSFYGSIFYPCDNVLWKETDLNLWSLNATWKEKHNYVDHEAKAVTCEENGWKAYQTCSRCEYSTYEEIPAGHDYVKHEAKAATCTEKGWKAYQTCSRCDYTTYEEIPALGHDYVKHEAKEATCTDEGWKDYQTCSRCDYTTYEEVPALGHAYVEHEAKAATCTEKGWKAYKTCSRCDYTSYYEIPALGHGYVEHGGKAPTCIENGWKAYQTCNRCDYTTYEEIPALGHDYIYHEAKEPTCEKGWNAYETCSRCDYTTYEEILPIEEHLFGEWIHVKDATVNSEGINKRVCNVCSEEEFETYDFTWIPYEVVGGNIYFNGETGEIVACDGSVKEVNIPEIIDGVNVTVISEYVFANCDNLAKVNIENGLKIIEDGVFQGCHSLTEIIIADSVTSIGEAAFKECENLQIITLSNRIKLIRNELFYGCSNLKSISFPSGVISIGDSAFENCTSLEVIKIPDTVKNIGECAFYDCTELKRFEIPASVTEIESSTFSGCDDLIIYVTEDSYAEEYCLDDGWLRFIVGKMPEITEFIDISKCSVDDIEEQIYEGEDVTPEVVVKDGSKTLIKNKDFILEYDNNWGKGGFGVPTVIVIGAGNYVGSIEKTFEIKINSIKDSEKLTDKQWSCIFCDLTIAADIGKKEFKEGENVPPAFASWYLAWGENSLEPYLNDEYEYELSFDKYIAIIDKYFINYDKDQIKEYVIKRGWYDKETNTLKIVPGGAGGPAAEILLNVNKDGSTFKLQGLNCHGVEETGDVTSDMEEFHDYFIDSGYKYKITSSIEFTIKKAVNGYKIASYEVLPYYDYKSTRYYYNDDDGRYYTSAELTKSIKQCTINDIANQTYTGKGLNPKVIVTDNNTILKEGINYTVSYSNNINPGTANVTIKGIGNYLGTIEKTFKINAPTIANPKTVSAELFGYDDFKVSWSSQKVVGATVKYKVEYKKYGGSWSTLHSGTTATSIKKANLADGVRYAFKVTPYVTIDGKNYYGASKSTSYIYTLKKLNKPMVKKSSKSYVKVSWNNIPGESGYEIARSAYATKNFKIVKKVSYKYKVATINTTRNKTYYYKIRAYKVSKSEWEKRYSIWSLVVSESI